MILSNTSIVEAIKSGRLKIDPSPPLDPGARPPFNTSAIDLTLGDEVSVPVEGPRPFVVDLTKGKFAELFNDSNFRTYSLSPSQPYILRPRTLVLAQTRERITLSIIDGVTALAARVEGRSGWARCGLLVHCTAPTIHAGFEGTITLEIYNLGNFEICLQRHAPVCQLILEEVEGTPAMNPSDFRGQSTPGGVAKR